MRFWLNVFPDFFSPHPQPLSPKADRGANTILFPYFSDDLLTQNQLIRRHVVIGMATSFFSLSAHAGNQIEEPLADSARTALSSAVANSAPPEPEFLDTASRIAYVRWLGEMSTRLGVITKQRLDLTTRCGTPMSSHSANMMPGRSPRSSKITSTPRARNVS